jgi:hypothetical protein
MTLYKHGVGFFTRHGEQPGETVALSFRKEEMNDVLKSLTAVATGGQVLGVDYQTPEDKAQLLRRSAIQLSDEASLRDLLRDARGRRVRITTKRREAAGVLIGVDLPGEREPLDTTLVSLFIPEAREVVTVALGSLLGVTLEDDRAYADLAYFLETSLTEEDKRAVTVRLSPGSQSVSLSYIAPSPVWRVSYRLVVDDRPAAHPEQSPDARALLQGWALFDNTLDEDLENVEVSFVAGKPVSFIYDLYTPFTPERPTIREEGRGVVAPVEFEGAALGMAPPMPAAAPAMARSMMVAEAAQAPSPKRMRATMADVASSSAIAATGKEQGEYFSYEVANPITVRRGRSAMAPILQSDIRAEKERLYNGQKHPRNPVIALRFNNTTGLTLERGPLTVVEAGEYAGEAMLPFTAGDGEIYLAYAVDLGITVTEDHRSERQLESVRIREGYLMMQEWDIRTVKYELRNRNKEDASVLVEHPVISDYEPFDTPEPAARTSDHYRHAVDVAAGQTALLVVKQRRQMWRREEIDKVSYDQLAQWLRGKALDDATYRELRKLLALIDEIKRREEETEKNAAARQKVLEQQKTIQGNLAALKETGEEGELRRRYARTLQEQEDRLAALDRADEELRKANEETLRQIEAAFKALS